MQIRLTTGRVVVAAALILSGIGLGSILSPLVGSALATVGQGVGLQAVDVPLTVDGTVSDRPAAPASPWRAIASIPGAGGRFIAGPSAVPINVTHVSASLGSSDGFQILLMGYRAASSATTCDGATQDVGLWQISDQVNGRAPLTPLSFTFPTPLQYKPPANAKACLWVYATGDAVTDVNAVGFYGG